MDREVGAALDALPVHPLLQEAPAARAADRLDPALRADLERLAAVTDSLRDRSDRVWHALRKRLGQPESLAFLHGVSCLAAAGEPAGARLLAALLDVRAPGAEMIARIHRFDSTRRLRAAERGGSPAPHGWRSRCEELGVACARRAGELPGGSPTSSTGPRSEAPLPLLRRWLEHLLAGLARHGDLDPQDTRLLISLARLEVDAYEERVSRAAGNVNPYAASAVSRILPLLGRADGDVRGMREFIQSLETGRAGVVFRRRLPRLHEALSGDERLQLLRSLESQPELATLRQLLEGVEHNPLPMRRLAGAAARLMVLGAALRARGMRRTDLDLLAAVAIAQRHEREGEVRLPVGADLVAAVGGLLATGGVGSALTLPASATATALPPGESDAVDALLALEQAPAPAPGAGPGVVRDFRDWPADGFRLVADELVLRVPLDGRADRPWPHDLPVVAADGADKVITAAGLDAAALKRLVLANLDNVSVTLGFLRNARVTGIPGLVAAIVARCRAARVLEVIATDRSLHTGFANKEVPRALLVSPCNIPVKSLAKFVHVKYVNRLDLQRMAKDKTGIRREVLKEIQAYLDTLGSKA